MPRQSTEVSAVDLDHTAVRLACELLRRPSITPKDEGCQDLLAARLHKIGFEIEAMPFADVSNLWARRGTEKPVLCLAGHTDVVPPGPLDEWATDPFEPLIKDGLLYSRGAADMKSSLAAMVVAAESFVKKNPNHKGSIAFLITSDEEGPARDGTLKVVETLQARDEMLDWCVLGEPSSETQLGDIVRIGRRGSLSGLLKVKGVQGHVAYPDLAANPIQLFAPALAELYATVLDNGNEHYPPSSFQVVNIQSGMGAPNVTPGELNTRFNFRYSTQWDQPALESHVAAILDRHKLDYELEWRLSGKPFLTREGRLTEIVSSVVQEHTGQLPELSTGGGTSDGRFISPAGADVVELGPVNASIHKINEHVRVADIVILTTMYEAIITRLLGNL